MKQHFSNPFVEREMPTPSNPKPTPYYVDVPFNESGVYISCAKDTSIIAKMYYDDKATAEYMVKVCNHFPAMLKVLQRFADHCMQNSEPKLQGMACEAFAIIDDIKKNN